MVNELLVSFVNTVLGVGKRTSKGNQAYYCPFCNHHNPKLEINFTENKKGVNPWHCWVCNKRGKKLATLFKHIDVTPEQFSQLKNLTKSDTLYIPKNETSESVSLPKEYKSLIKCKSLTSRHALTYLKNRNITLNDIIKYNIGYCEYGPYSNMIIIPSYNNKGKLNYFTSRSFKKDSYIKYKNPDVSRDIIPFELFINWDLPIILCEGPFDAITIRRNVIPLLGKNIQPSLMKKLVTSRVKKIYIALDKDAIKKSLEFCEILLNEGKEVYLVELQGKDPNEMGFENFTRLIQKTPPIDQFSLMEKKISLI